MEDEDELTKDELWELEAKSVEDVKDQLEDFGNYYFWYDGRLYESSDTDFFGFVDMETCELVTPRFGSFEESADYPFFDGRSMREAFDDIEFLAE